MQTVVQTHGVADRIRAKLYRVDAAAHKIRQIHFVHGKIGDLQIKAFVPPDGNQFGAVHCHTQQTQQGFARVLALGVNRVHQGNGENILAVRIALGVLLQSDGVSFCIFQLLGGLAHFCGEPLRNGIFQPVMLVVVGGFQGFEPRHLNIQIHFLLDHRIACRQRLYLGIRQRRIVQIVRTAGRTFAGHDLPDELLLGFQKLPHIAVEGRFCDITVFIHLGIGVALANHTPVALLNVRGFPPTVQMMRGNQYYKRCKFRTKSHLEGVKFTKSSQLKLGKRYPCLFPPLSFPMQIKQ